MRGCMDFPLSCLSVLEHQKQPYLGPPDEGWCIFRYLHDMTTWKTRLQRHVYQVPQREQTSVLCKHLDHDLWCGIYLCSFIKWFHMTHDSDIMYIYIHYVHVNMHTYLHTYIWYICKCTCNYFPIWGWRMASWNWKNWVVRTSARCLGRQRGGLL